MGKSKKNKIDENYMSKFGMLVEYNYNVPPTNDTRDILLDEEDEEELDAEDFGIDTEDGVEDSEVDFGGEPEMDMEPEVDAGFGDEEDAIDDFTADAEAEIEEPEVEVGEDGVELDVTDLVNSTEEAKEISNAALSKIDSILNSFNDLETRLSGMEDISAKIDSLEQEFEKRNPTDVEKMEMRSLDSYPYNLKLTDFWTDKEGYDVGTPEENTDEGTVEYKLTDDVVDATYNEEAAKDSFENDDEDENI